jgi:hypothetical protein
MMTSRHSREKNIFGWSSRSVSYVLVCVLGQWLCDTEREKVVELATASSAALGFLLLLLLFLSAGEVVMR